ISPSPADGDKTWGLCLTACLLLPAEPKPNISLRPSGGVAPGETVTVRCECRCRGVRVLLSKAGDLNARRSMDPTGDVAEFPIRIVSQGDAGNYSCQYRTKWDPLPVWSEPSDPVELVVAGEGPSSVSRSQPHTQPDPQGVSERVWAVQITGPNPWVPSPPQGRRLSPGKSRHCRLGGGDVPCITNHRHQLSHLHALPRPDRCWFYSHRGNRPDSSRNGAGSHAPRQPWARYRVWGQEIAINSP
uniref:Ig-like domain-containing protein n=1 Tax=Chrysemys picta bellii TaxID=8478 RepID=A0A8C3F568_CHRPI